VHGQLSHCLLVREEILEPQAFHDLTVTSAVKLSTSSIRKTTKNTATTVELLTVLQLLSNGNSPQYFWL